MDDRANCVHSTAVPVCAPTATHVDTGSLQNSNLINMTNCNDEETGVPCDITRPSSVCTVDTNAAQYSLICGSELRHVLWKKCIRVKNRGVYNTHTKLESIQ